MLDNRPLRFDEWRQRARQTIYVSATPAEWELAQARPMSSTSAPFVAIAAAGSRPALTT